MSTGQRKDGDYGKDYPQVSSAMTAAAVSSIQRCKHFWLTICTKVRQDSQDFGLSHQRPSFVSSLDCHRYVKHLLLIAHLKTLKAQGSLLLAQTCNWITLYNLGQDQANLLQTCAWPM